MSAQLLEMLSPFATNGRCEKTSYDDFYLEVSGSGSSSAQQGIPEQIGVAVHVVGGRSFAALPAILRHAVQVIAST